MSHGKIFAYEVCLRSIWLQYVEGLKHNLLSIGYLIQKGYRVYIEDYHCVIKDTCPSDQLIAKVPMTSNRLFPLRIVPDMKVKTNTGAAFKAESKETVESLDKKENGSANLQAAFQTEVPDESWLWHFRVGHLNFGGIKLLYTNNMVKGLPLIDRP